MLNALDAMAGGGVLSVRTRVIPDQAEVTIEVEDNGPGISADQVGKIFEPFYTTKPPGQGTGLGLSIAYGIIQDHAGRIEVESEQGRGSIFRVYLPIDGGGA
jgi:signal transduction histidine kinase